MPEPLALAALIYCLRLCGVAWVFIGRLLTRKRLNRPLHKARPTAAPQEERFTLAVKFSASLTRRTL